MVSPPAKKSAAKHLQKELVRSERHACNAVGISRSTLRYKPSPNSDEKVLREKIRELALEFKRYGYRRIHAELRKGDKNLNVKKVHRIWKEEGLCLARKRPPRRRYGPKGEVVKKAKYPNHVWTYDFLEDRTESGDRIRILNVVDEFTREALAIRVERKLGFIEVLQTLNMLLKCRGVPKHIRSDNGPEFIANEVKKWLEEIGCETIYIHPGSPWENPYIESYHGKFRDECLNMHTFSSGHEAKEVIANWMMEYNEHRPHSSLNYLTPAEFYRRYVSSLRATPSGNSHTAKPPSMVVKTRKL